MFETEAPSFDVIKPEDKTHKKGKFCKKVITSKYLTNKKHIQTKKGKITNLRVANLRGSLSPDYDMPEKAACRVACAYLEDSTVTRPSTMGNAMHWGVKTLARVR
ncbi:jg12440 [Pararge aegeria aegeria]|uniref:Jg12440 protein n=1 Tax=Pararge aegeria aegeria TaxID=348720 RepID=A0A8S4RQ27_9NEOP|nr:jg12440 [Pararge aegeria aegeria]